MKKTFLYTSIIAVAFSFAACNEDYTDWAAPQSYAQEAQQGAITGTIKASANEIDLNYDNPSYIPVVDFVSATNATEGSKVVFTKLVLNDAIEIPFITEGNSLKVLDSDLYQAVKQSYGSLAYTTRICRFKVKADLMNAAGTSVLMPIEFNEENIPVTSYKLPTIAEEEAFYYVGGYNGWALGSPTPMTANGDGTYSCIIDLSQGSEWFCFAPQSSVDSQNWNALFRANTNGDEATSGFLNTDITSNNSFCAQIEKAGKYKFTIDPRNFTYSYGPYAEQIFFAGDAYGWPADGCPMTKNGDDFVGYYYITIPSWGSFKFVSNGNWYGGADGKIDPDGGNITPEVEGYYRVSANMNTMTYGLTQMTSITCVGNHNGWNVSDASQHMTFNADEKCWEITTNLVNGFKFAMNDDWAISWGGANGDPSSYDVLTEFGGKDLNAPEGDGTYNIKLYLSCEGKHKVVLTKQ